MEIITSHNALDFDGLAAMVAAGKIYPGAVKVFSGTLSKNVRQFMALYKDLVTIKLPREIDLTRVERMIIVDTANAKRLGQLKDLALNPEMDIHIFDHHPSLTDDLQGHIREVEQVGAATTLLVEKIMASNINISSFDATILALGIYEDTGSLLFTSTTVRDVAAVEFLLSRGANLAVVANFMELPFSGEQRQILQALLDAACHYKIKNIDVVIAESSREDFVPGMDLVTYRLLEVENSDVVFVIAFMEGKANVIGRSRTNGVKVNEVLKLLGGRGHHKAASAVVKGKSSNEIRTLILRYLEDNIDPGLRARDIMSTPVKTVAANVTMEEVGRTMLRYGHTGMPVIDGDKMIGVISRRDVDKARMHDLGHAPVKGFMTSNVCTVSAETPVNDIQRLMVENDIGRLPIVEQGRLVGIVSRTDILRTFYGDDYPEDHEVLYSINDEGEKNCLDIMEARLPSRIMSILRAAGEMGDELGYAVYCVGGFVRDLFLRVPNYDLDLVVEGDGETLAQELADRLGGRTRIHERFKTAVLILPDGMKIDVATARTEFYEFPAALPKVEKSSIREDMYRRDFTINTLALALNPVKFGHLIDYFGGLKDLEKGQIRILYNLSFVEDPTRVLRAIRFEQRYKFTIEPDTLRFARDAIQRRLLGKLSYQRILQELILILSEKDPLPALRRMVEIGVWEYILPEVNLNTLSRTTLKRVPIVIAWLNERFYFTEVKSWLVYMLVIMSSLSENQITAVIERYSLDKYVQKCIHEALLVPHLLPYLSQDHELLPSDLDQLVAFWNLESIIYLLLCIKNEEIWEKVVAYLDIKESARVEIDGNDLVDLGLKPGPVFGLILQELYKLRLNQVIVSREEEIELVKQWLKEGKFNYAIID